MTLCPESRGRFCGDKDEKFPKCPDPGAPRNSALTRPFAAFDLVPLCFLSVRFVHFLFFRFLEGGGRARSLFWVVFIKIKFSLICLETELAAWGKDASFRR